MKSILSYCSFIIILFISACSKDNGSPVTENTPVKDPVKGVLVLNEGTFGLGNASISFIHSTGEISNNFFQARNDRAVGDVLQSAMETEDAYYFVVNNSALVEKVNKFNMKSMATITGFESPRYMLKLNDKKALVTNLKFDTEPGTIDVVDLETNAISGHITINGACEELIKFEDKVFVANSNMNQVLVIDASGLTITKMIPTAAGPMNMVLDRENNLWVLCSDFGTGASALVKISTAKEEVEKTFVFDETFSFPGKLVTNASKQVLYFLNGGTNPGVYAVSASQPTVNDPVFIGSAENEIISAYGLGVDPETGNIYVGDAKDFASNGEVVVFDPNGKQKHRFSAGVAPNGFNFR